MTDVDAFGFCADQPAYAEPAVLTTDRFELSVRDGRREVRERAPGDPEIAMTDAIRGGGGLRLHLGGPGGLAYSSS